MAISGSGTQGNPYIFETAEDFLQLISRDSVYIEAKEDNMEFDFNNVEYTLPLYFNFYSLNAKGLTILNLLSMNNNDSVINITPNEAYTNHDRFITGLNIYNLTIIKYAQMLKFIGFPQGYNGRTMKFTNCNFAGLVMGYGMSGENWHNNGTFIGEYTNESRATQLVFENTTFNIHLKDPTNTSSTFLFTCNYGSGSGICIFKNCSICISGNVPYKLVSINLPARNVGCFNCVTFTNNLSNPLVCQHFYTKAIQNPDYAGNNYYKMKVTTSGQISIDDTLGLIDEAKFTAGSTRTLTGIVLTSDQTHVGPSPQYDYIYNDANLQAHGFIVGQVII